MKNLLLKCGQLTKNKFLELQVIWSEEWTWFKFYIEMSRNCDHQGFTFRFEIYKLDFNFMIYDIRHFDYDTNDFEVYENEDKAQK